MQSLGLSRRAELTSSPGRRALPSPQAFGTLRRLRRRVVFLAAARRMSSPPAHCRHGHVRTAQPEPTRTLSTPCTLVAVVKGQPRCRSWRARRSVVYLPSGRDRRDGCPSQPRDGAAAFGRLRTIALLRGSPASESSSTRTRRRRVVSGSSPRRVFRAEPGPLAARCDCGVRPGVLSVV